MKLAPSQLGQDLTRRAWPWLASREGTTTMDSVHIQRHHRAAPFHWEWHTHQGTCYLEVGIAHPRRHTWWATSITVYLPAWVNRTPLARVPSTGWRAWGDKWAPVRPWKGGSKPWARKQGADS